MFQEERGSYTQLSTINGPYNYTTEPNEPMVKHKRTHFSKRDCTIVIIMVLFALLLISITLSLGLPKLHEKRASYFDTSISASPQLMKSFTNAAISTDGNICAPIGKDILKQNGSAVDSAIALLICGGVVTPQSMGLGGGFLMTIYHRGNRTVETIDAREAAPLAATEDMFHGNSSLAFEGGLSIAVPGEIKGYSVAHQKYGNLKWEQLFEPSIKLAEEGFPVSAHLSKHLTSKKERILRFPNLKDEFFNNKTGDMYKEGEILKRPALAQTLKDLAKGGAEQAYTGEIAKSLAEDIKQANGIITEEDFKNYEVKIRPASSFQLPNGDTIYSVPPPGSGHILSFIFNILQGYNLTSDSVDSQVLSFHRIVEAFKFAYSQRTKLGDNIDLSRLLYNLTSPSFGAHIRNLTSDKNTFPPEYYGPTVDAVYDKGTAHVSVLAENGDAVSVTSTVNSHFGSMVISPKTGIIFNNEMDDFSSPNITNQFGLPPSPANFIAPAKRPMSSMSPAIIVKDNGDVDMVIGAAGGSRIISSIAWAILRMKQGDTIKQAIDYPRLHHQLYPNKIQHEKNFPILYLDKLHKYLHETALDRQESAVYGIVRTKDGKLDSVVDYRKGGSVDGY